MLHRTIATKISRRNNGFTPGKRSQAVLRKNDLFIYEITGLVLSSDYCSCPTSSKSPLLIIRRDTGR